jgi:hypothetical protein
MLFVFLLRWTKIETKGERVLTTCDRCHAAGG